MSSIMSFIGVDPQFLTNYLFGLVIIILYAKDKFNTPTYDKESMGPFSQLPPQLLTIDARYRQGMRTYIFLLLALYTALCIIGPSTFNQQNIQLGIAADANQFWPVASATFLISTGAAKDSSILGRIEHFIRQYAQKTAYIPSIVSNLAYSIRNVETIPWLKENKDKLKQDEFEDRKAALTALIGEKFAAKINENPRQQGHLAAWARANIVFYCMQQMFRDVLPSERLSQITDVPENVAIFERLKKEREELERRFISAEEQRERKLEPDAEDLDKLLVDVQRFSKEVSLTIVVLLSQAVRTFSDLKERLEQLGFREIELRDNSDHLVYIVMVNFSILLGAFVSYALATGMAIFVNAFKNIPYISGWMQDILKKTELSNDFSVINHAGELLLIVTGVLIYMIVFKVIDYLREGYLDLSEWRENLQGYVMVVVTASLCSAVICILLMVLLLSPLGLIWLIWTDPAGLAQQFLFQFLVAGLAAGFTVSYLRHAVDLQWRSGVHNGHKRWSRIILGEFVLFREGPDYIKVVHGVLAACLVGVLTHAISIHARNNAIEAAKSDLETLLNSFDQNQGWLGQQAKTMQPRTLVLDSSPTRDVRLLPKDLIDVSCKLQNMYAAIHVFDVEARDFQLDPDFTKTVNEGASNSARESASATQCRGLKANGATIADQIDQLKAICSTLNRVGMKAPQNGPSNSPPPEGVKKFQPRGPPPGQPASQRPGEPPGQRIIAPTLFLASEKCELSPLTTDNVDEQNFRGLGNSLSKLFYSLDSLNRIASETRSPAVVFPMITAFFIAYTFGAGCRVWRAWWLNNEAGQQEMDKLKDQIENIYGQSVQPAEFEQWLISPLSVLNNVAPKEAVRYEGLKARLYAKIESKQIDFGNIVA
jgi:hypothetical protein